MRVFLYHDVLTVLRLMLCIQVVCPPNMKADESAMTKTRTPATILRTGTRASSIQDGEDVNVLRSPVANPNQIFTQFTSDFYLITNFFLSLSSLIFSQK